ncbi:MAG: endolytic transglycosylase MltG, partial [Treponema sp.]|nr:endolytic transglycosylase MltG [Treponema sp.]
MSLFICFSLLVFALAAGVLVYVNSPPRTGPREGEGLRLEEDGSVLLEVRKGESAWSVGKRLEESGLIRTRYFWRLLSHFEKEYIKSGSYRLEIPASQMSIHALLVQGRQMLVRVTVPEGITLKKAARIFGEAGICGEEDFLLAAADRGIRNQYRIPGETMEGYLFPDTYLFPQDYPAGRVIRTMADNFFLRLAALSGPGGPPAELPAVELYK